MGVTRDGKDIFFYGYIEDDLEELQDDLKEEARAESKKKRSLNRNRLLANKYDSNINYIVRKKTGAKQARRCENLKYLLTLTEKDDESDVETDMFEPSVSHFTELFMEQEKMKIWNDFINSSEDEQNQILRQAERKISKKTKEEGTNMTDCEDLDEAWEEVDKRASHPAFTAQECFQKIDKHIKSYLKRRHVPMGVLESLERDLVAFFTEWPSSVYLSDLKNSFERMMLHALCQYLDLLSSSYDDSGNRRTQVENKHEDFVPPSTLLTEYLIQQRT